MDVRKWYLGFAETEASGSSPTYERLAREVADSPTMIGLLEQLPPVKRQPNLLFAAARFEGVSLDDSRPFVEQVASEWDRVSAVMRSRATSSPASALMWIQSTWATRSAGCGSKRSCGPNTIADSNDSGRPRLW